jgi:hypothetical protein
VIAEFGMPNAEFGFRISECGMRNAECGMRNEEAAASAAFISLAPVLRGEGRGEGLSSARIFPHEEESAAALIGIFILAPMLSMIAAYFLAR